MKYNVKCAMPRVGGGDRMLLLLSFQLVSALLVSSESLVDKILKSKRLIQSNYSWVRGFSLGYISPLSTAWLAVLVVISSRMFQSLRLSFPTFKINSNGQEWLKWRAELKGRDDILLLL
jgi:hypothetical protein